MTQSAIDWRAPIQSRDGRPARLLEQDGWQKGTGDTRRRVMTCNYVNPGPKHEHESYTTWLCGDDGRTLPDGEDSIRDIVNGEGSFTWAIGR